MNELAEFLVEGLLEAEAACESSIRWNNQDYPCSGGSELRGKKLDIGGFNFHADCVVVVRAELFGAARPQEKQTFAYTSAPGATATRWRIDAVRTLYDAILVLEANYPS